MPERKPVSEMDGAEFVTMLGSLSRKDLEDTLIYLWGYTPDGMQAALDHTARVKARIAEMRAELEGSAK